MTLIYVVFAGTFSILVLLIIAVRAAIRKMDKNQTLKYKSKYRNNGL